MKKIAMIILMILYASCSKQNEKNRYKKDLFDFCRNNIKEISIFTYLRDNEYYISIKEKKILNEFKNLILENTFIPQKEPRQFNRDYIFTIKTGEGIYSIQVLNYPYTDIIKNNSADIDFFKKPNFDSYDLYYKIANNLDSPFNLFHKYGETYTQLRNYKLDSFLKKYIYEALYKGNDNKYGIEVQCHGRTCFKENPYH
ncbi:MAG: hypothetical protein ACFFG0_54950 [Candidatus Thorarchaeota archaeon]